MRGISIIQTVSTGNWNENKMHVLDSLVYIMKKLFMIMLSIFTLSSFTLADIPSDKFFATLAEVESNSRWWAVTESELAYGVYQIRPCVIKDVNSIQDEYEYEHEEMFNPDFAKEVAIIYLDHWSNAWKRKTGNKEVPIEVYARIWNGGPNGWKRKATIGYWNRFKRAYYK